MKGKNFFLVGGFRYASILNCTIDTNKLPPPPEKTTPKKKETNTKAAAPAPTGKPKPECCLNFTISWREGLSSILFLCSR